MYKRQLLDRIQVDYYGSPTPINQLANISTPEARMLVIQPWDKSAISAIEKAILKSDLGITPTSDGIVIRLVLPQLTQENRKDLVKRVKKKGEEAKVSVRNIRRDGNDELKALEKSKEITEDESKGAQENIQKLTDKFIAEEMCIRDSSKADGRGIRDNIAPYYDKYQISLHRK